MLNKRFLMALLCLLPVFWLFPRNSQALPQPGKLQPTHKRVAPKPPTDTSQESDAQVVNLPTIEVSNTFQKGIGSLDEALKAAHEAGGNRRIIFKLDPSDQNYDPQNGTWTIKIQTPIVFFKNNIVLDGLSQIDYGGDTNPKGPEIILDGRELDSNFVKVDGKDVFATAVITMYGADKDWVRGFTILSSHKNGDLGLRIATIDCRRADGDTSPVSGNLLTDNYIGLNADGETLPEGSWYGIFLETGTQDTVIENNTICGPGVDVYIFGSSSEPPETNTARNIIRGNHIGTNAAGTKRLATTAFRFSTDGLPSPSIFIRDAATQSLIENNIIAGTRTAAIGPINRFSDQTSLFTTIRNNRIGIGANGENIGPDPTIDQAEFSIGIFATLGDIISGNIIGNFGLSGIQIRDHLGKPVEGVTEVSGNQISDTPIGLQLGQLDGVLVSKNTFSRCSKAGISLHDKLLDSSVIFTISQITNPFGFSTHNVTITQNNFVDIGGPAIGFMGSPNDLLNGTYVPNVSSFPTAGPNSLYPSPELTSAVLQADKTILVKGKIFRSGKIEFFASPRPPKPSAPPLDFMAYGLGTYVHFADLKTGEFSVTIPASKTTGISYLTATLTGNSETSEMCRTIQVQGAPDYIKPTVTVTAPEAGLVVESKDEAVIDTAWTSSDFGGVVSHTISLSGKRNGVPFVEKVVSGLAGNTIGFRLFVKKNDEVIPAQVIVEAADAAGNIGQGMSGVFSIVKPDPGEIIRPLVKVLSPTEGTVIESKPGAQVVVAWTSSDNVAVVFHRVTLLKDGVSEVLATGLAGNVQNYIWNVPINTSIARAQVMVEARDPSGNVGSDTSGVFSVVSSKPTDTEKPVVSNISVSRKKVTRKKDANLDILWTSKDNVGIVSQDISFAADGSNFTTRVVSGLSGTTQKFTWTIPASVPKTTTGSFLIEARDAAGNTGIAVGGGPLTIK